MMTMMEMMMMIGRCIENNSRSPTTALKAEPTGIQPAPGKNDAAVCMTLLITHVQQHVMGQAVDGFYRQNAGDAKQRQDLRPCQAGCSRAPISSYQ